MATFTSTLRPAQRRHELLQHAGFALAVVLLCASQNSAAAPTTTAGTGQQTPGRGLSTAGRKTGNEKHIEILFPLEGPKTQFLSSAVDEQMHKVLALIKDENLKKMFANTFPNTLNTTVEFVETVPGGYTPPEGLEYPDTFVITGDIPAMWLRDSANQVLPYYALAKKDPRIQQMLRGVLNRQVFLTLSDPHANAFNKDKTGPPSPHLSDRTFTVLANGSRVNAMANNALIYERKFELDSLAAVLRTGVEYYDATSDPTPFTPDGQWVKAVDMIARTARRQQLGTDEELDTYGTFAYQFQRDGLEPLDSLIKTVGSPAKKCGLIRAAFRPSDDAMTYPYHVPSNAMFAEYLARASALMRSLQDGFSDTVYSKRDVDLYANVVLEASALAAEVREAVLQHGVVYRSDMSGGAKEVFAYEVDCFGNYYLMDDANIPGLLSLPLFAPSLVHADERTKDAYSNTRRLVLSNETNPYFYVGPYGEGVGGPHVYLDHIWPMSIIVRGWTALLALQDGEKAAREHAAGILLARSRFADAAEIAECIRTLLDTHAGTYFMHESFLKTDPSVYSRPWFAWANSLFGGFLVELSKSVAGREVLARDYSTPSRRPRRSEVVATHVGEV